jgi:hypothetical protein
MLEPESVTVAVEEVVHDVLRLDVSEKVEFELARVVERGYPVAW